MKFITFMCLYFLGKRFKFDAIWCLNEGVMSRKLQYGNFPKRLSLVAAVAVNTDGLISANTYLHFLTVKHLIFQFCSTWTSSRSQVLQCDACQRREINVSVCLRVSTVELSLKTTLRLTLIYCWSPLSVKLTLCLSKSVISRVVV